MNRTGMQIMLISALVLVAFFALAPLMCQLAKAQTQYSVNIWAWDYQGGWQVPVRIYRDGVDTGFNTPATFIDQTGTHTFTVPNANSAGHPFSDWDSGGSNWTDPTLTVSSAGTYTARYRAGYSITIWGWDYINGWSIPVPISIDGTSSGFSTPHTFTDLNGPHYFTVPNTNSAGHLFSDWSNDWTDQDLTVSSAGVYTARYREGYSVTITAWCVSGLGWMSRPITLDGSYTGFTTPHTFYLVGTHTIEVPSNDEHGDPFVGWDEGASSSPTITVYSAGVFTAKYRHPPIGSIVINNGAAYTTSTSVTLSLTYQAFPTGSVVSQARYSNDGVWDTEVWETPAASKAWVLASASGDGVKAVYFQVKDSWGMLSPTYEDTIILDTTPPTGSFVIDEGAVYTNTTWVSMHVTSTDTTSGIAQCRWSEDGVWDGEEKERWLGFDVTPPADWYITWNFTLGDGVKTLYLQLKDHAGLVSPTYTDSIILDTYAPKGYVMISTSSSPPFGNDPYTSSTSVTIFWMQYSEGASGLAQVRYSNDGLWDTEQWENWVPSSPPTKVWTLTPGDGSKTVYCQLKSNSGMVSSATISDTIILDTSPPIGSMVINGGATTTSSAFVTLTLSANDPESGVTQMRFMDEGNSSWSSWEAYATTKAWTLTPGDGVKNVFAQFKNGVGLISIAPGYAIILQSPTDTTPPTGSITINGGAASTSSTSVTLTVSATDVESGVTQMRFSNDAATWSNWEAYTTSKSWTLTSGDGLKTVYAQFKNGAELDSISYSDSITLQSPADITPPIDCSILINDGAASTSSASVTLSVSAADAESGVAQMRFSNDLSSWSAWEAYATSKSWTLSSGDGGKTVYVLFRNGVGLDSPAYSDTITLQSPSDITPPSGSITINGGAATTNSASVVLTLSATDPESGVGQMRFSNDGTSWSSWEPYTISKSWTLTSGDGTKTAYVQFKNGAGLTSTSYSDSITLQSSSSDTTPPVGSITINGGATTTNSASVTLTLSATDNSGVVSQMRFANLGESWTAWEPYSTSKSWTLTSGTGAKTVLAQFTDGSGIESAPYGDTITVEQYYEERTFNITIGTNVYTVTTRSNSSTSDFSFNQVLKRIRFTTNGTTGTTCFCNITVPATLMSGDFSLFMNDVQLATNTGYTQTYNGTHYTFSISHTVGLHAVEIFATNVVPEYPVAAAFVLLMMLASVIASKFGKRIKPSA